MVGGFQLSITPCVAYTSKCNLCDVGYSSPMHCLSSETLKWACIGLKEPFLEFSYNDKTTVECRCVGLGGGLLDT